MRVGMIDTHAIRERWDTVGSKLDERGQRVFASGVVRVAGCRLARVAPKQVFKDVTHTILTQAETEAQLKERGLPVELLEHLRIAPVVLDLDEDEDPYGLNDDDVLSQEPQK
jgi:hypothetical protein